MTPNEINEAIARSMGWTDFEEMDDCVQGFHPDNGFHRPLPDYYADLNACAEFEQSLSAKPEGSLGVVEQESYADEIYGMICGPHFTAFNHITATAPHRCEAYLKVKGLWK